MSSNSPNPTDKPKRTPRAKSPTTRTPKMTTPSKPTKTPSTRVPSTPRRGRTAKTAPAPSAQEVLDSLITLSEAIKEFDLKRKKARKALENSQIPARKIGKDWVMRRADAQNLWGKGADSTVSIAKGAEHAVLDEVLTSGEAAEELGLKKKVIRKAAKSGAIAARKLEKGWLIRRVDLQAVKPIE